MNKKTLGLLGLTSLLAYLLLWPVPIEPVVWHPQPAPAEASNPDLSGWQRIDLGGEREPEHVVQGPDGRIYTGLLGGRLLSMAPDGRDQRVLATTRGRPLGLAFDAQGRLIVADAVKGLLAVLPDSRIEVLSDTVDGQPLRFADAVAVARNGRIYFTDASTRFGAAQWGGTLEAATIDLLEQSATGRVLEYDPASRRTRVVARGLSFANGLLLSQDQQQLLVCETGRYRVWKIAVQAESLDLAQPSPQASVLLDNLPGFPDNLTRGADGRIWLGLAGPRNALDALAGQPWLRKIVLRLPRALRQPPRQLGHVLAFDESGRVLVDLQDASDQAQLTTGLTETDHALYVHNASDSTLAWRKR